MLIVQLKWAFLPHLPQQYIYVYVSDSQFLKNNLAQF